MLLGSDYTEGVAGIGVVNALEVVSAWPGGLSGLAQFKSWLEGPDERLLAAAAAVGGKEPRAGKRKAAAGSGRGAAGRKRGKRAQGAGDIESESEGERQAEESGSDGEEEGDERAAKGSSRGRRSSRGRGRSGRSSSRRGVRVQQAGSAAAETTDTDAAAAADDSDVELVGEHEDAADQQQVAAAGAGDDTPAQRHFKSTHRGVRRTWHLPASFPSQAVMDAYLKPLVDRNAARFSCGRPDTELLQQFCR